MLAMMMEVGGHWEKQGRNVTVFGLKFVVVLREIRLK
jgi:hypothetical protein